MKTTEYLAAAKRRLGIESNAAMAARLGLSEAALSRYDSGNRVMDDYTAAHIADILGIDPIKVIAQANAEREKDSQRVAYWLKMAASFAGIGFVNLLLTASPAKAAPVLEITAKALCIMSTWRACLNRDWRRRPRAGAPPAACQHAWP